MGKNAYTSKGERPNVSKNTQNAREVWGNPTNGYMMKQATE